MPTPQTPSVDSGEHLLPEIFLREPFLLNEMTPDEFERYILLNNDEVAIEQVDFNPSRITA